MPGQNVQRGRGHKEVGSSRSMLFPSSESVILCLKYGIKEFLYWVIA